MTYEYECPRGHVTELVQPMSLPRPKSLKCACGRRSKRVMSRPEFAMNVVGGHGTVDSTERAYGKTHVKGLIDQRETVEWMTALGAADGHEGDGKSNWALPSGHGVRDKKDQIKAGVKPPESATFGIKREVLQKHGIV